MATELPEALLALQPRIVADTLAALAAQGAAARRHCEQEVGSCLEHLAVALELDSPALFHAQVRWAGRVLAARGVAPACLVRSLEVTHAACAALPVGDDRARALALLDGALRALAVPPDPAPPAPEEEVARYVRAAVAGRRREILDLALGWLDRDGPAPALTRLARAQHEVGELWLRHEISVAAEHRATALAQLALTAVVPFAAGAPGPRPRGRAVVVCAPGDWHSMGPRIGADLLELAGFDVEFLGANVPAAELARVVDELHPALVGVGVAPLACLPAARAAIGAARAAGATRVVAGGYAARAAGAAVIGADAIIPPDFAGALP